MPHSTPKSPTERPVEVPAHDPTVPLPDFVLQDQPEVRAELISALTGGADGHRLQPRADFQARTDVPGPGDRAGADDRPGPEDSAAATPPEAAGPAGTWRFRVVAHQHVDPTLLIEHPDNFKAHPDHQRDAIREAIATVGFVGEVYVSTLSGRILDGHARVAEAIRSNQPTVPVGFIDCESEEDELRILATYDPIGQLAVSDFEKLEAMGTRANVEQKSLRMMLGRVAGTRSKPVPEEPSGRVIGRGFGPQGGRVAGGHIGKLPAEVWPVVVECLDEDAAAELMIWLGDNGYAAYSLDPGPSSLGEGGP